MDTSAELTPPARDWWDIGLAAGIAILAVVVIFVTMHLLRRRVLPRLRNSGRAALTGLAAGIDAVRMRYVLPIAALIAADFLVTAERWHFWLRLAAFALVGLQLTIAVNRTIVTALRTATAPEAGQTRPVMFTVITWSVQFVIWLTFLLAVLAAGGVNITAFVASLGVGGIAVALALQNILGDLFASISIGLDKPFAPGDYIAFDGSEGTVSHIGVKSTRITSLGGEELSIANSQLLAKLTHNYSRMSERRATLAFAVPMDTPREQLSRIVDDVSELISAIDGVRLDRGHLTGLTDAGFTFEYVYYLADADYSHYRDVHQRILGETVDLLARLGVSLTASARAVAVTGR